MFDYKVIHFSLVVFCVAAEEQGAPMTVELAKGAGGIGFTLEGGKGSVHGDRPLVINRIFTGTLFRRTFNVVFSKVMLSQKRDHLDMIMLKIFMEFIYREQQQEQIMIGFCVCVCGAPGGAAEQSGLQHGDELLQIQGVSLQDMTRFEAWNMIKALPEGSVRAVIRRRLGGVE